MRANSRHVADVRNLNWNNVRTKRPGRLKFFQCRQLFMAYQNMLLSLWC